MYPYATLVGVTSPLTMFASDGMITDPPRPLYRRNVSRVRRSPVRIGVGFGLAYVPGAGMDEIERMLAVAAQRRVAAFVHTRNGLAGLDSTLTAARTVGASLHVVHANSSGGSVMSAGHPRAAGTFAKILGQTRDPQSQAFRASPLAGPTTALLLIWVASACDPEYPLVIEGGRVMDPESGLDAVRNVAVAEGRIAVISEEALEGARVIDARRLVVAPGLVDLHRHGQNEVGYQLQVQDGVTTGLELELGTPNVAEWLADRARGRLVNYGVAIGHLWRGRTRSSLPERGPHE